MMSALLCVCVCVYGIDMCASTLHVTCTRTLAWYDVSAVVCVCVLYRYVCRYPSRNAYENSRLTQCQRCCVRVFVWMCMLVTYLSSLVTPTTNAVNAVVHFYVYCMCICVRRLILYGYTWEWIYACKCISDATSSKVWCACWSFCACSVHVPIVCMCEDLHWHVNVYTCTHTQSTSVYKKRAQPSSNTQTFMHTCPASTVAWSQIQDSTRVRCTKAQIFTLELCKKRRASSEKGVVDPG